MAKEVVITSVPRGIKLGRTGFQVIMRTAGTADVVLSSLEQLAGYRHVHPQGSGRNPLIYSYRTVRGPAGELTVLSRTVDAGNDFSNRSNKLAHLLAIDPGELTALRTSSPAAVLAAIDGRLAQVWQGGPEERPSPVALPAPPVQPAACRWWNDVKGDGGWGGLLAQRALRGQASLVIAPDCSPTWSRRLLDLFQEVLALLPRDGRWKTSFETTVIGNSSSLLRGTYAGSPESAAGYAGLLVVDLSQRAPLPANVAPDELITIAREGPKQSVAGRAPPMPGGFATPAMPTASLATTAMPTGGLRPAGPLGPTKAPVAWGDDDDAPRSRLGWYILTAVVLAGVLLAGGMVGGYLWLDARETERLTKKIEAYADIEDGKDADDCPTLEEWQRAFRKDPENTPDKQAFDLLLSALRTKPVNAEQIKTPVGRAKLLKAVREVLTGTNALANAHTLGVTLDLPDLDHASKACAVANIDSFLEGLINEPPKQSKDLTDVGLLQTWVDESTHLIFAASEADPLKKKEVLKKAIEALWPDKLNDQTPDDWINTFARDVQPAKQNKLNYKTVLTSLENAITSPAAGETNPDGPQSVSGPSPEQLAKRASDAFESLRKEWEKYQSKPTEAFSQQVILAGNLSDTDQLEFEVVLPSCGNWKPFAEQVGGSPVSWHLRGLPGSGETDQSHWGTIEFDQKNAKVTFTPSEKNVPPDFLYAPIRFTARNLANKAATEPRILAKPQKAVLQRPGEAESCSLYRVLQGGTLALPTTPERTTTPCLLKKPNTFKITLNTNPAEGPLVLETRAEKPESDVAIVDVWYQPGPDTTKRVWLEALACRFVCDDHPPQVRISLLDSGCQPWPIRKTRFAVDDKESFPPNDKHWPRNKLVQLVENILDDSLSKPDPKVFTVDSVEKQFKQFDKYLELRQSEKPVLSEWREKFLYILSEPHRGFRQFVENAVTKAHGPRPEPPTKPQPPRGGKEVSEAEAHKHDNAIKAWDSKYREFKGREEAWNDHVDVYRKQPLILQKWLEETRDKKDVEHERHLGLIIQGIDSWVIMRDTENRSNIEAAAKKFDLIQHVRATLDLEWAWDSNEPRTQTPRLAIEAPKDGP